MHQYPYGITDNNQAPLFLTAVTCQFYKDTGEPVLEFNPIAGRHNHVGLGLNLRPRKLRGPNQPCSASTTASGFTH